MENQITPQNEPNPFALNTAKNINEGTVTIESSRAVAEAQGKLVIAKKFPRNEVSAFTKAIEACRRNNIACNMLIELDDCRLMDNHEVDICRRCRLFVVSQFLAWALTVKHFDCSVKSRLRNCFLHRELSENFA